MTSNSNLVRLDMLPTSRSPSPDRSSSSDPVDGKKKRKLKLDRFFHFRRYRRSRLFTPLLLLFILVTVVAIILGAVFSYSSSVSFVFPPLLPLLLSLTLLSAAEPALSSSQTLKQRSSTSRFSDDVEDLLELYGRVQSVDVPGAKITVVWSIFAYSGNPNSSLFLPGTVAEGGLWAGYSAYPIGEWKKREEGEGKRKERGSRR